MVKIFKKVCIIPICLLLYCIGASEDSDWTIEWQYLSLIDSSAVFQGKSFNIINSLSPTGRTDTIDSIGRMMIHIIMPGYDEDVISQNPTLTCSIFDNDNIVFDTTISWAQMEFKEQHSDFYGLVTKNVSKKVIYINK